MKEKILLGGYTKRVSKGVYSVLLDSKKAELSALTEVAAVQNPTYITLDQKGHLYTCAADGNGGGIAAFDFDGQNTTHLGNVTSTGALCVMWLLMKHVNSFMVPTITWVKFVCTKFKLMVPLD